MNLVIISGSNRSKSQSGRIAEIFKKEFTKKFTKKTIHNIAELKLPFWDESLWKGSKKWEKELNKIIPDLKKADALIIISPEWAGMAPPMLKNYLLLCDQKTIGHKPALLVSVSSGINGAYPVSELRSSGYKNNKLLYIPEHIIIRNCEDFFTEKETHDIKPRIQFATDLLHEYAKALKEVRKAKLDFDKYPYGM